MADSNTEVSVPTNEKGQNPFWLTYAHQHDSGRVCLLNQQTGIWYVENGPGSGRVRSICDSDHPTIPPAEETR